MAREHLAARCRNVQKIYWTESGEVRALNDVSADFRASEITAVMGPSGSGKSSLLRIVAALDRPTSGTVHVQSVEVTTLSRAAIRRLLRNLVGYVFQSPAENFVSYLTVWQHLLLAGRRAGAGHPDLEAILTKLGIVHRAGHLPHELSGGEQQRAAFAQVLAGGASLIVADEPTAELDGKSSEGLLEVVRDLTEDGVSFILATHDAQVAGVAHHVIEIDHGHLTDAVAGEEPS